MKVKRITTREQLESLPEGRWIEVEEGMEFDVVDLTSRRRPARVVIPLKAEVARSLRPRQGEVLEARLRGRNVELTRRRTRARKVARRSVASPRA